ncbi:MAG: glycerophosphodiester phosphodiesterase [Rikenellaceae bacterium]|jgi:glycerophosphoryl diester phosphodiesterase|nr:glycerophosphodiester phosphodiesterase [Rikenellaceae bacterium]
MIRTVIICSLLSLSAGCGAQERALDTQAHRGGRGLMPENTIAAMLDAIDRGVTTLEMDLQISRDRRVVVSHDPWFNHKIATTPDGRTLSSSEGRRMLLFGMDYDSIRLYDVGLKPHPDFPRQKKMAAVKPLLADLLRETERYAASKGRTMRYNIEIKSREGGDGRLHPPVGEFVDLAMAVVDAAGIADRTYIQSFDMRSLQYLHSRYPAVAASLLTEADEKRAPDELWQVLGFVPAALSPEYTTVTEQMIALCHKAGVAVVPWTVNDRAEIVRLTRMGVDAIISDYPDLF